LWKVEETRWNEILKKLKYDKQDRIAVFICTGRVPGEEYPASFLMCNQIQRSMPFTLKIL
jgi:hypothetical protein